MKIILQHLGNIVLIGSIFISIFFLVPLIPKLSQWYQLAVVKSSSMEPALKVGSLAIYKTQTTYYPGEIIAYQTYKAGLKKLIIHRIVEKNDQTNPIVYLTQGDATQFVSNQPVFKDQVKGKLIGSIPRVGYLIEWFKSSTGVGVFLFFLLTLLVIEEFNRWPLD